MLGGTDAAHTSLWIKLVAGSMSGFVGSVVGNPTDLLKVKMQASEEFSHSLVWHVKDLYSQNGIIGFYRGIQANVCRAMILNAMQLGSYDHIKHTIINFGLLEDGIKCHLVSSICAGIAMALATSPADIIKTRLMNQPSGKNHYKGFFHCGQLILKKEGFFALWKGFTA